MKNTFSATFSVLFFPSISVSWVRGGVGGRGEEWFCSGGKDREAHTFDVRLYRQPRWTRRKSGNSSNVNLFVTNGPRNCFLIFIPFLLRLLRFEEYREIMRPAHGTCPLQESRTRGNELFFFDAWKDQRADFYLDVLRPRSRDERDAFQPSSLDLSQSLFILPCFPYFLSFPECINIQEFV